MRVHRFLVLVSAFVGVTACSEQPKSQAPDLTFLDSLDLTPALSQDSAQTAISPAELALTAAPAPAAEAVAEKSSATSASASRTSARKSSASSTRHRSSSAGSSSGSGSYGTAAPQPRVETVKHTKRDAAIGAGAGAVIGAVAGGSRHRVKGAVIGAAAGGILGAVIGNNVDKGTRVTY